jgi:CBS domain-containing protein
LPNHQRVATALSTLVVSDAMTMPLVELRADVSVREAHERAAQEPFSLFPVLDAAGVVQGLVSQARLARRVASGHGDLRLAEVAQARECLRPSQPLVDAVVRMNELGARQMLVVSETENERAVGMLALSDIMRAYASTAGGPSQQRSSRPPTLLATDATGPHEPIVDQPR